MAQFTVNSYRQDTYKNYNFVVSWNGKPVAGVSKLSPLKKTTQVIKHRDGADPSTVCNSLGQTDWDEITLERGVTHDTAFEQWANKAWDYPNSGTLGQQVLLEDFRKDIVIDVMNEAGQKVISYKLHRCWPSSFTALPELDGNGNAVAIQSLVLQTEGWERVESVTEPTEPSFNDPSS